MEQLLDEKELLAARIDEIEIAMISARGAKLQKLVVELDELEEKKEELKRRIKALEGAKTSSVGPVPSVQAPPAKKAVTKAKRKKVAGGAGKGPVPPKPAVVVAQDASGGLRALEEQLEALEKVVAEKEDEELRLRYELEARKRELYEQEASLYAREQRVLKVSMSSDPGVAQVVKVQRRVRAAIWRRRWKGKEPKLRQVVESYKKTEEAKAGRIKWNLVMDVYRSQKAYVDGLLVVKDKYVSAMRKTNHMTSGMTRDDIQEMFGIFEVIAGFENDIFVSLTQRLFSPFFHPSIGDLFLRLASIFPVYVDYCRGLDGVFAVLARLQKTSVFPSYIEKLYLTSGTRASLTTLLELPAQRLFQYETILSALVQLTNPEHGDFKQLKSSHKAASDAVAKVNLYQEEKKSLQKLNAMMRHVSGLPDKIMSSMQKLIREQDVTLIDKKRIRQKMFLMDNTIVLATYVTPGKGLKFAEEIPLLGTRYHSRIDDESVYNGFDLQTMSKIWTFVCDSYDDKMQLEKVITEALRNENGSLTNLKHSLATDARKSAALNLQQIKLESEIAAVSENISRLPKDTLEKLRADRFSALVGLLADPNILRSLSSIGMDTLCLAVQALDTHGRLREVLHNLCKGLIQFAPSEEEVVKLVRTECLLTSIGSCVTIFSGRTWLSNVFTKHLPDIRKQGADFAPICKAIVSEVSQSIKSLPPLLQDVCFVFRQVAHKKFRGGGEVASLAFFVAVAVAPGAKWSHSVGLGDSSLPSAFVEELFKAFGTGNVATILDACHEQPSVPATFSKSKCEKDILPPLLEAVVRDIGAFEGPDICKAVATAVVLK